jgi:hypothetical protein
MQRTIDYFARAGDSNKEGVNGAFFASQSVWGPLPVSAAIGRCEETLRWAGGRITVWARVLRALGILLPIADRVDDSVRAFAESRRILEDLALLVSSVGRSSKKRSPTCFAEISWRPNARR